MRIGIVGATGEVGRTMMQVLAERRIAIERLDLYASARSGGIMLPFRGERIEVKELTIPAMEESYDYLLFSAGGNVSRQYAPTAEEAGNTVIDNSSAFRRTHPLVVPEVNGEELKGYRGIVANPNCSTIQLVLALYPLHLRFGLEELIVSTYQAVSGAGHKGIEALKGERSGRKVSTPFPGQIDLNVIPEIGEIDREGHSEEERKMLYEIGRIMGLKDLKVAVTTVRVPVLYGHAESVFARFRQRVELAEIGKLYREYPVISYSQEGYISPVELDDSDQSYVGRMRRGFDDHSLQFWNVGHNVRIGAATNAVKILEKLTALRKEEGKR